MAEEEILEELEDEAPPRRAGIVPMVAVLVATLGGGGFVGMSALGPKAGVALAERAAAATPAGDDGHGGGVAEGEAAPLHVVDNLVVNPAASGGSRFLLTSIALQATSPDMVPILVARDVEIRDAFIMVLGAKTVDELTTISNRPGISQELLAAASALVGHGVVHRILIPQFVIQ